MTHQTPIDPKQAEQDPAGTFASPQEVLRHDSLSREEKLRILRRWKLDALEIEVATEEAMTGGEASRLDEVIAALDALGDDTETAGSGATKQGF